MTEILHYACRTASFRMTSIKFRLFGSTSTIAHISLRGLGGFDGIVQGLAGVEWLLHYAPAVVVVAETDGRVVVEIAGVEGGADFVERSPAPGESYVGEIALLADAGDLQQLFFSSGDGEARLLVVSRRQ